MTEDANQPGASDGLWDTQVWPWVTALVVVVTAVCALWVANHGEGPEVVKSAPPSDALQSSFQQYQAGKYADAIASAKAALALNPDSADAYNNLAVSYLALGRYDDGIVAAQEAIRLRADFELAKNNLAWIQREKAKAFVPPPPSASELLNRSLEDSQAGRFKECMDTASQAAKADPTLAEAFNNVGFCAARLQLWEEAIRNTQEALRLRPDFALARNNLAWMKEQQLKSGAARAR